MILLVLLAWGTAFAQDDNLNIDLFCPQSASYGAGSNKLNVTASFENCDCQAITVQRYMSGLIANSSSSQGQLGSVAVYGPYARWTSTALTIPAATCPQGWPESPGVLNNQTIYVMNVPNVPGRMAMAFVNFITNQGAEITGESCMVSILP